MSLVSAVQVLERMELDDAEKSMSLTYDLVVFSSGPESELEAPVTVMIGVIPPELEDLVTMEDGIADVVDWNRTAPLLQHVQLREVQIGQELIYAEGITDADVEERGYEVLVTGASGPLVLQKREGLGRCGLVSVSYGSIHAAVSSSIPCAREQCRRCGAASGCFVGSAVGTHRRSARLSVEPDRDYVVRSPAGTEVRLTSTATGLLTGAPPERWGVTTFWMAATSWHRWAQVFERLRNRL